MPHIAGHNFTVGPLSNRCSNTRFIDGVERQCGRNLVDILNTTEEDIGKDGIACVGALNSSEYEQIKAERERIWNTMRHP